MSMQTFQFKMVSADDTSEQRVQFLARLTKLSLEDLTTFTGQYGWNIWPA